MNGLGVRAGSVGGPVCRWGLGLLTCGLLGCGSANKPATNGAAAAAAEVQTGARTRAPLAAPAALEWFEDAAEQAFAEARKSAKPVLADLWAPWCHTCLAMQDSVLTAAALPQLRSDVVLLAIDTEKPENEQFLSEFPVGVWPTFYVLDATTRQVRGRWLGAASAAQLGQFLADSVGPAASPPLASLREGDALAAKKDFAGAAAKYRAALAAAPTDWERRGDALVSLASALAKGGDDAGCLDLMRSEAPSLGRTVSAADFTSIGLGCADRLPPDGRVAEARRVAAALLTPLCEVGAQALSVDDRADACATLRRAREALGDSTGAKLAAAQGLRVIEEATRDAPPGQQLIHDWARSEALVYLGRRDEAIVRLVERERQLPESYNPPHYLARLYRDEQAWELGLLAIERALALAYGPRKIGLLGVKVDLLIGAGRTSEARTLLQEQLSAYQALPAAQRQPAAEAAVEKRLEGWK